MADIARASGLVRTTVYAHFPTREALIDALLARALEEVTQAENATLLDQGRATRRSSG